MDNYVIWEPERNGHAPPFWKDGMEAEASYSSPYVLWTTVNPKWGKGGIYRVPPEAVNGPQIDDARDKDTGLVTRFAEFCKEYDIPEKYHGNLGMLASMALVIGFELQINFQPRELADPALQWGNLASEEAVKQ
jgi:hypothetical protein